MAAPSRTWGNWVLFGALVLGVAGSFNLVHGVIALVNEEYFPAEREGLLITDYTTLGVVMLVLGAAMIVVAFGLASGAAWARLVAIVLVSVHAVAQFSYAASYPLWTVIVIAFDVVVLYALTAGWAAAAASLTTVHGYRKEPEKPRFHTPGVY